MPKPVPSAADWKVANLRLTTFLEAPADSKADEWWMATVGVDPEKQESDRRKGVNQYSLGIESGRLFMALQPGRADWLYFAHWDDAIGGQDVIGTESIADALTKFAPIVHKWLALDIACTRIAFGSNISQPTADKVAGYKLLAEYLPAVSLDPEKTFDFNYQINRARVSTIIDDLRINRLTKWSVIKFVQARVDISSASPQVFPFGTPSYSVQLELDMNTAEDRTVRLDSGKLGALLDELQGLAFEIAEQGDIQ